MTWNISEKIKSVSKFWWIFLAIILVGIFLRTYHFHDWLRFNADQGRDAEIVSEAVDGAAPIPLLGPKAGGTEFKLGGAFYYLEMASAKIFGNSPDKMAYPDLFTGILCIPLLFFFLRKYFNRNISLAMSAIFAVSNYAIRYARFAWNPNSTPFWTMLALYAMHEVIIEKKNRKVWWSIVAGVAIGIGVQLHTTLLLFLPITAIIVFGWTAIKNIKVLKYFFVILAMSLLINAPQLFGEYQTGGKNLKAFFGGIATKQEAERSIFENVLHGSSCWVQGNLDIISGYEISDKCSFVLGSDFNDTLAFLLGVIFVIGGTIIGIMYAYKEKDLNRKAFLRVVFVFIGISFLIFIKLAFELSVRFYLILIFLPFLTLGFWMKFFEEKLKMKQANLILIIAIVLVSSNLFFVDRYFANFASYTNKDGGNYDIVILSQVEAFSQFIVSNSNGANPIYLDGDAKLLFKAFKPIRYLAQKSNINVVAPSKKTVISEPYFYLGSPKDKDRIIGDTNIKVLHYKTYGQFAIMYIQNNMATKP